MPQFTIEKNVKTSNRLYFKGLFRLHAQAKNKPVMQNIKKMIDRAFLKSNIDLKYTESFRQNLLQVSEIYLKSSNVDKLFNSCELSKEAIFFKYLNHLLVCFI